MESSAFQPYLAANPLHGLRLKSRADLDHAMQQLLAPLDRHRSAGFARVQLSPYGAVFDHVAAEIEGFARPLWALAAAQRGGSQIDWYPYREGLANGTNPAHPEYWGAPQNTDQRLVELAAVGFALLVAKDQIFDPLPPEAKANIRHYLLHATGKSFSPNNWMFFRLLIDAGLRATGDGPAPTSGDAERTALDALYLGQGWYRDGPGHRVDHYNGFAFHTYGLLLHHFAPETDSGDHLARARLFAPQFARWFDAAGRGLPFGRSMTYRFGMVAFFAAYALADPDPVLPMGVLKGLILRNLRWWADQPIADRDGILSIGYAYPNPQMAENYNSAGSPYWAMKAFLMLAMPEEHPFWTCDEMPLPPQPPAAQTAPRFLIAAQNGTVTALSGGQMAPMFRHGAEKYAKLCYSTHAGFCVEAHDITAKDAAFDNTLAIKIAGADWLTRQGTQTIALNDDYIHARWTPFDGIQIDTLMCFCGGGHMRLHHVQSDRLIELIESGFAQAADRTSPSQDTVLMDLSDPPRTSALHRPAANVSLLHPHVLIPRLGIALPCGSYSLGSFCGVLDGQTVATLRTALNTLKNKDCR
ncbi:DUF2264 domain-containing protein [Pseudorhodobacter sp. W20_MBD10_FR17]|uniref:DUF2264 domain-containing protein n=1 Tax=Pseudorhodobacter sp. W20_MBD10_FR17 TaxID=3240266 RepID=UPI003F9E31C5